MGVAATSASNRFGGSKAAPIFAIFTPRIGGWFVALIGRCLPDKAIEIGRSKRPRIASVLNFPFGCEKFIISNEGVFVLDFDHTVDRVHQIRVTAYVETLCARRSCRHLYFLNCRLSHGNCQNQSMPCWCPT